MGKSIVLVGLVGNHHSLYEYVLTVLLKQYDRVSFITQTAVNRQIHLDADGLDVLIDDHNVTEVLERQLSFINKHEILILDEYFGSFYRIRGMKFLSKKRILIIHNANKWSTVLKKPVPFNKIFIDQLFKHKLIRQIDAFVTVGPNVKEYLLKKNNDKPIYFLPFNYSKEIQNNNINSKERLTILIPGMISNNRRNYVDLLKAFEGYLLKSQNPRIYLIFLGRILSKEDKQVTEYIDRINGDYKNRIKYWSSFIDQEEFDQEIINSDLVLSNIYPTITSKRITEYYGKSKESGISFVIYKYAKPAIVPVFQNVLTGFDSQLIRFNSYLELVDIFEQLENKRINIENLNSKAQINKKIFNGLIEKETTNFLKYINQ